MLPQLWGTWGLATVARGRDSGSTHGLPGMSSDHSYCIAFDLKVPEKTWTLNDCFSPGTFKKNRGQCVEYFKPQPSSSRLVKRNKPLVALVNPVLAMHVSFVTTFMMYEDEKNKTKRYVT